MYLFFILNKPNKIINKILINELMKYSQSGYLVKLLKKPGTGCVFFNWAGQWFCYGEDGSKNLGGLGLGPRFLEAWAGMEIVWDLQEKTRVSFRGRSKENNGPSRICWPYCGQISSLHLELKSTTHTTIHLLYFQLWVQTKD